jgi:hypothetical protein
MKDFGVSHANAGMFFEILKQRTGKTNLSKMTAAASSRLWAGNYQL